VETLGLLQEIDYAWLAAHFVEHIASTDGALRSSTQAGRKPGREPWRGCSRASAAARHGRGLRQRGEEGRAAAAVEQGRGAAAGHPWSRKVEVGRRWKKDAEHRGFGRPCCWPSREEHGKAPWEKLELAAMGRGGAEFPICCTPWTAGCAMLAAGIFWAPSMGVAAVVGEERDELEREELRELLLGHTIGAEEEGRHGVGACCCAMGEGAELPAATVRKKEGKRKWRLGGR
jgi:hypothetical protein